jgi:hypothetical protein
LKPLPVDETTLKIHWHSRVPMHKVAAGLGISKNDLESAWRRLKSEGKLPRSSRRINDRDTGATDHFDGRPRAMDASGEDPMVELLRKAHPERIKE